MISNNIYKEQKKFFTRFLKENNVYVRYIKYIKNKDYYNCYQKNREETNICWSFDSCAKEYGMRNMVSMLITWSSTPEGGDFWSKLSDKFKKEFSERFY